MVKKALRRYLFMSVGVRNIYLFKEDIEKQTGCSHEKIMLGN
jgi:hypothetical protein